MINYFCDYGSYTEIFSTKGSSIYKEHKSYINYLANKNLIDIGVYRRLAGININVKYNIPIYINKNTLLIKFREYYINYYQLYGVSYDNDIINFIFKDGLMLSIIENYKVFSKYIGLAKKIDNYINEISNID